MSDAVWKILSEFGETERSNVWTVQSATVIKHACLERVAAKASIMFDAPQVLRAERDEAVILVTGRRGERMEWSIGEALVNGNYRVTGKMAAYPFAMAEKRAKDRVILKLINLHGLAYSEDEADDFKEAPAPREAAAPAKTQKPAPSPPANDSKSTPHSRLMDQFRDQINAYTDTLALGAWWNGEDRKRACRDFDLDQSAINELKQMVIARKAELEAKAAA